MKQINGQPYAEVIGDPIAQSKSPAIHGFWIERLGLDADYRATQVDAGGLADYVADRRTASDWCGCNVIPINQTNRRMIYFIIYNNSNFL